MQFSFVFFLVYALITLSISYHLISKSKFNFVDKFILMMLNFTVFSSFTILNEYLQPINIDEIISQSNYTNNNTIFMDVFYKDDIKTLEKQFFLIPNIKNDVKLPISKNFQLSLLENLGFYKEIFTNSDSFFYWVESEKNIGTSYILKEFFKELQHENYEIPIIYMDLSNVHQFIFTKSEYVLKIPNNYVLEAVLANFNKNKKTPILIFDAFEKSFFEEIATDFDTERLFSLESKAEIFIEIKKIKLSEKKSKLFENLLYLFSKYDMKIVVISYNKEIRAMDGIFPHFIEEKNAYINSFEWQNLIYETMNSKIEKEEAKFNKDQAEKISHNYDINFDILYEYLENHDKIYKNPESKIYYYNKIL